jgi:hypothetical protein
MTAGPSSFSLSLSLSLVFYLIIQMPIKNPLMPPSRSLDSQRRTNFSFSFGCLLIALNCLAALFPTGPRFPLLGARSKRRRRCPSSTTLKPKSAEMSCRPATPTVQGRESFRIFLLAFTGVTRTHFERPALYRLALAHCCLFEAP